MSGISGIHGECRLIADPRCILLRRQILGSKSVDWLIISGSAYLWSQNSTESAQYLSTPYKPLVYCHTTVSSRAYLRARKLCPQWPYTDHQETFYRMLHWQFTTVYRKISGRRWVLHTLLGSEYRPAVKVTCVDRSRVPVTSWVPHTSQGLLSEVSR